MNFLWDLVKGIIIGMGAVAPGVSGGTFAVILGVYDKLTDAIANIFINFKKKLATLFPLGLGIGIGVLLFSRVMKYLFEYHEFQVKFLFIGLMVGTLPSVFNAANKKGFRRLYLIPFLLTFSIAIIFMILEKSVIDVFPEANPSLLALVTYGVIIGFGSIVPGVSSSFILMYIGAYEILLDGIVGLDFMVLIPVGLGFGLSILLFAKIMFYLFKRFYGYTYYTVLGFVMGSILTIVPVVSFNQDLLLGIGLCVIGMRLSYSFSRDKKRNTPETNESL